MVALQRSFLITACLGFAALLGGDFAIAQNNFVAFELERESNWDSLITEDLNGDGAKDLIFSHYQPGIGRELHIHHQQLDGGFSQIHNELRSKPKSLQ